MPLIRSIALIILIFSQFYSYGQDTIPPILLKPARDTSFECGKATQLNEKLTAWFNLAAGAEFEDNSGIYDIITNISLGEAMEIFNNSKGTLCGNTQYVEVIFSAIDASGNISEPDTASFYTIDTSAPTFNYVPNVQYACHNYIRDTLIAWIKDKGGYVATDACSDSVVWTTFTYGFFVDNVQISSGSGNIANGPYPRIPDGTCAWTMKINFFVKDDCQNQSITPGTTSFSVIDTISPIFLNFPEDVTVSCQSIPTAIAPEVLDGCSSNLTPTLEEVSTQAGDESSCDYYNYEIVRTWTVQDKCGNATSQSQTIIVRDTLAPQIEELDDITLSCAEFEIKQDSIFGIFRDNCSITTVTFTDDLMDGQCSKVITRTYTVADVCLQTAQYQQQIVVKENLKPVIIQPAQNVALACDDLANLDGRFYEWVLDMGGSEASPVCGAIYAFAAMKGSYDANDLSTFPGITPTVMPPLTCPSGLEGWLRYAEVDFVYYDSCGNVSVTPAIFGIQDITAPEITACSEGTITISTEECQPLVKVKTPEITDDCVSTTPTITQKIITELTSQDPPGPEAIFDPVTVHIGPFNPHLDYPFEDGIIQVKLVNLDIDDPTEYFNIYDEDGTFVGISPRGPMQCSSVSFDVILNKERIKDWVQDGYIDIRFEPNVIQGDPVFSINNICGKSTIEVSLSFDIGVKDGIRTYYILNSSDTIQYTHADSIELVLQQGINKIDFIVIDCAHNIATCSKTIEVIDQIAPQIHCPSDISSVLALGVCTDEISIPINFTTLENCAGNRPYSRIAPGSDEATYISYSFDPIKGVYEARNKQLVFNDIFPIRYIDHPATLEVEFFGDNNEAGESFEIYASDGTYIGATNIVNDAGCTKKSITAFTIERDLFNQWISNNQISFLAVPMNSSNGINPCIELSGNATIDRISYIKARLSYSDAAFTYSVSGATTIPEKAIPNDVLNFFITLNGGKNTVEIKTQDAAGNTGSCSLEINVIDQEPPTAICKNAAIEIHPSGLIHAILDPELINNGSFDNCGDVTLSVAPSEFDCSFLGANIDVILTARDAQGNEDQCTTLVKINSFPLNPTYSSGLCSSDTLKLFANVPDAPVEGTYTFKWQGPQGTEFFTENPVIPNPDERFNGTYTLTVTGFNGCTAVGSVLVNVKPLTNPEISTSLATVCTGTEVILSGTAYNGDVFYDWFEGIYPTGVLLGTTRNPDLVITPAISGPHFYYMIARNPDCSSNPSPLLKITVEEIPQAVVKDIFQSPCEGGQIVLSSTTNNPKYTYEWTGPGGYTATGSNPPPIKNINEDHAGDYLLIVKNGTCVSDTAITRVTILESPATPIITGLDIICEGEVFSLIATQSPGAEKYEWYKNGVLFTTTQDNSLIIPNAQTSLQGDWTVTAFKGNCTSPQSSVKFVGVDAILQIGVINSGPVCQGDSVTLQATFVPNVTYKWSGPVSNIPDVYNPIIPGIPGDYSVTITTPTGCKNNANTTVSLIAVPEITALSSDELPCLKNSDTIRLLPSVFPNSDQYKYQWTGPDNFNSNDKHAYVTDLSIQKNGKYTLVVYNGKCPSEPYSIDLEFNITPETPTIIAPDSFCEGDSIKLEVSGAISGAVYEWSTPKGTLVLNNSFLNIPDINSSYAGSYSVRINGSGCISSFSPAIQLTIRKKPSTPVIDFNALVCYGDSIFLKVQEAEGVNYHWSGPNNTDFAGDSWIIPSSTKINSGLYTVVAEINGCKSLPAQQVNISVRDEIKTPQSNDDTFTICGTQDATLEVCIQNSTLTPDATYTILDVIDQQILAQGKNACQTIPNIMDLGPGTFFLSIQATVGGCHSLPSDNLVLNINTPPDLKATAVEKNIIVCPGENARLIALHGPPQVDIKWTASRPEIIIDDIHAISPNISGLSPGNNVIYLDYSVNGCPEFSRDTVRIYAEFEPDAEDDYYHIQYGSQQLFQVLANDLFPAESQITIIKQPDYGSVKVDGQHIVFTPDVRSIKAVSFTYRVCASFCDFLCSEATVYITFDEDIECLVPTIFTPNNDGINDYFIIPCLETGKFPNNRVTVFNEWGVEVYSAKQYKNDWSGNYGSSPLPAGTYFYVVELGDNSKPINGFLILQR
ncbi:MAG: gliding motility-associated C-terminal domain-containing protein [Chitinophagales bacterium]|nr:gliding motility-associated C-terminal domain-containing protein [Chitinophagales bacterium]